MAEPGPWTLHAASYDADVELVLESPEGAPLASDSDSALETNAVVHWTAERAGDCVLRIRSREASQGSVYVQALRGTLALEPADPELAARAYWQIARDQAVQRGDGERADAALARLCGFSPSAASGAREQELRELGWAQLRDLAVGAEKANSAGDRGKARETLQLAIAHLRSSAQPSDAVEWTLVNRLLSVANAVGPPELAVELGERWLAFADRFLYAADPDANASRRLTIAGALAETGQLRRARELAESAYRRRCAAVPPEHATMPWAAHELGRIAAMQRDFEPARALLESVVERAEHLERVNPNLLAAARNNLAAVLAETGEHAAARAMEEQTLAALRARFPAEHPRVLQAMNNHAITLHRVGELERAMALNREIIETASRDHAPSDQRITFARYSLAVELHLAGRVDEAERELDEVLALHEESLAPGDPTLLLTRATSAAFQAAAGRYAEAAERCAVVAMELARVVPEDDEMLAWVRRTHLFAVSRGGSGDDVRRALEDVLSGAEARMRRSAVLSVREAQLAARAIDHDIGALLAHHSSAPAELAARIFEVVETRRVVANSARTAGLVAGGAELTAAAEAARERVRSLLEPRSETGPFSVEALTAAVRARDRAERELGAALAQAGRAPVGVSSRELAATLGEASVFVGFVVHPVPGLSVQRSASTPSRRLVAFVVKHAAAPALVDLGDAREIEAGVARWRRAVGRPLEGPAEADGQLRAGVGGTSPAAAARDAAQEALSEEYAASSALAARIVAPLMAHAPDARTWIVCSDGPLHAVPLEALAVGPLTDGRYRVLGEQLRIAALVSLQRSSPPRDVEGGARALLAVGGIDYGTFPSRPASTRGPVDARRTFAALPATLTEARALARRFESAFGRPAKVLSGGEATEQALAAAAPGRTHVHIASHGYFAPPSSGDAWVQSFAPWSLCGLALAGANGGRDEVGRELGVLSAAELAALDLSSCELAVLSACDTDAGVSSSGAGLHSLRAALHSAGARHTVTSLWSVDDAAAVELMDCFYARLFDDGASCADALWSAKSALRARGAPTADWAGWIASGEYSPAAAAQPSEGGAK